MKKSWHLDRRTFLRGAGLSLGLPFLNAMELHGQSKAIKKTPKRVAFIFANANGVSTPPENDPQHEDWYWFPKGQGKNYHFRKSQEPLNPLKEDISVISGLSNPAGRTGDPHQTPSGFLTTKHCNAKMKFNSISIDQVICNYQKRETLLAHMPLSGSGGVGNLRRAYTLAYDKDGKGIPAWSKLSYIYERMYMFNSPKGKARIDKKTHLLNEVYNDAKDLKRNLGIADQNTLDEYLTSISEVEKKIENDKLWAAKSTFRQPPKMDLDITMKDVENYIQSMYDLMYLAFKADITRVATYQLASEGGSAPTNNLSKYIGLSKDIHALSHASKGNGYTLWGQWDQFLAKQFGYFINKLKETKEGDGTLLDNCLLFHGSATSKTHKNVNYPLLLAGGKNLGHKSGQFVQYEEEKNALADLYVRIANGAGVPITKFGDSLGNSMSELFTG